MEEIKKQKKTSNKEKEENSEGGFRFRHTFIIILVLLLLLSLFSHNSNDLNVLAGGIDDPIKNWIGPAGAHIARDLLYMFGIAAYPLMIFLVLCALRPLIPIPVNRRGYIGALIAVIAGTTIIFGMYPDSFQGLTDSIGIGHSSDNNSALSALSGGVLGQKIAAPSESVSPGILRCIIGTVGTFIVGSVFLLTGLIFIWISDWQNILTALRNKKDKSLNSKKEENAVSDTTSVDEDREKIRKELRRKREKRISGEKEEEPATTPSPAPPAQSVTPSAEKQHHIPSNMSSAHYSLPPLSLLQRGKETSDGNKDFVQEQKEILQETLDSFGVDATVTGAIVGPRVTRYEITPEPGVKVEKISALSNNIAMDLKAKSIRILAPIPGRNAVGVEAANLKSASVSARKMMEAENWQKNRADIPVILGKDVGGKVEVTDLAKSPHLLIAGATGSGKSVCINMLIISLLYRFSPEDLRLIMVDPKVVEFEVYKDLPHLITPIVNDPKKVPTALRWAINEMERRYKLLGKVGVRNLESFNSRKPQQEPLEDNDGNIIPDKLPYIVIIIDELADIMMIAKADVETSIARIAQKARAVGIHMVLATQTPRKDIITGVIKANLPSRIAFRVGSNVDSRVIVDRKGAESLLGQGDMLFLPPGSAELDRIQGAWVSDEEIKAVVNFVADQAEQEFLDGVVTEENEASGNPDGISGSGSSAVAKFFKPDDDENIKKAIEIILTERKASTSYIQRRLKIGYNRAADIIDQLEDREIIGPQPSTGGANREILVDIEEV